MQCEVLHQGFTHRSAQDSEGQVCIRVSCAHRINDSLLLGLRACNQCPHECKWFVERPEEYMIVPLDAQNGAGAQYWMVCCAVIGFAPPSVEVSLRVQGHKRWEGMDWFLGLPSTEVTSVGMSLA